MTNENNPSGNMDARVWAREFIKVIKKKPSLAKDKGFMIAWFANAIMTGYDAAKNEE